MSSPLERFTALFSPPRPVHESNNAEQQGEDHNKNSAKTGISPAANVYQPPRKGYQQDALFAGNKAELRGVKEDRCEFHFADGRQCRNQHAQFCVHHSSRKDRECRGNGFPDEGLLGLEGLCGDLTTATNINRALSHVFLLMAQGRIPQKQAMAFGYITQLLLQTIPGIRSEYVSVHGYDAWETNLKSKIITPPLSTPSAQTEPPTPTPPPTPSSPDYDNLLRRSRNLLARKYDTTPEGRREANALALELELMNPAPAKPRRDFFSRTVALVRHLRARQPKKSAAAARLSPPPAASPNKVSAPPPSSFVSAPAKPVAAQSPASPPATHEPEPCSSGRGVAPPVSPAPQAAAASATAPPHDKKHDAPPPAPEAPPTSHPPAVPIPGFTLTRDGHSSDWYAPGSWSRRRQPDPFPSRQEKLKQSLRTMSNSRWRRLQHQMQNRHFWR